jgi:hypothetical protein
VGGVFDALVVLLVQERMEIACVKMKETVHVAYERD